MCGLAAAIAARDVDAEHTPGSQLASCARDAQIGPVAQHSKLSPAERIAVRGALVRMPEELAGLLHGLSAAAARERRAGLAFSAARQGWHVAALGRAAIGRRI